MFYVYILECGDRSCYTGHTDELEKRVADHQAGEGCEYTAKRLPVELVYTEPFATRDEAFHAEQRIKGWSRKKKEAVMAGCWERLSKLSNTRRADPSTSSG